jgi:hypothetical protein
VLPLLHQREGLHTLGVVSKAGPRVREEVPKASSRQQCPRWLGFVAYREFLPVPLTGITVTLTAPVSGSVAPTVSQPVCLFPSDKEPGRREADHRAAAVAVGHQLPWVNAGQVEPGMNPNPKSSGRPGSTRTAVAGHSCS